jgi:peptidoglycan hydrolase-like protein with peptidoglycan-binding domain
MPAPAAAPESKAAEAPTDPTMSLLDMQRRLTELGYKPGPVDGKPGQRTTNALKKFQREHKLPATGTLDVATIRALEKR